MIEIEKTNKDIICVLSAIILLEKTDKKEKKEDKDCHEKFYSIFRDDRKSRRNFTFPWWTKKQKWNLILSRLSYLFIASGTSSLRNVWNAL